MCSWPIVIMFSSGGVRVKSVHRNETILQNSEEIEENIKKENEHLATKLFLAGTVEESSAVSDLKKLHK